MVTMPIELYTDGSCLRNPGVGGIAYVIKYYEESPEIDGMPEMKTIEFNQGYRLTTNNRMEIMAGIQGVRRVIDLIKDGTLHGAGQLNMFTDSEYFANSINMRWIDKWQQNNWMTAGYKGSTPTPVKNKDLWEQVLDFQNELKDIGVAFTINWVKGHDTNEWNNRADQLAVAASNNSTNHLIDEIYEKTTMVYNRR